MMRYVFFGTPRFAAIILKELLEAHMPPVGLVCNPDRPAGRKQIVTPPETKQLLMSQAPNVTNDIMILQPEKLGEVSDTLRTLHADVFVVAAYAKIIKKEVLEIPSRGAIGVHPSLLPNYRGPSPIQAALLAGDEETGVTLYQMDEQIDHGAILSSSNYHVSEDNTYVTLEEQLAKQGATLLIKTLPELLKDKIKPIPQVEAYATYTRKFTTDDGFVEDTALTRAESGSDAGTAQEIYNKIRALNPEPSVWTMRNGKRVKLLEARLEKNRLRLIMIQKEGKTPERC